MPDLTELLERNRRFAASIDPHALAMPDRAMMPDEIPLVLTCVDPRTEPAGFLGVGTGDAGVLRTAGGRVNDDVVEDIAYLGVRLQVRLQVAVIHHTQCGTGMLADPTFRRDFAERTGLDEDALAAKAVADPAETVRRDVARLLASPLITGDVVSSVSGLVLHLETGLVETVLEPTAPVAGV